MLPTTNILQRTFLIKQANSIGTAFSIEVEGREYLVTARHVLPDLNRSIEVRQENRWKVLPSTGMHHHPGEPDIAIITLGQQMAPRHPLETTLAGTISGQDVLMAGFPFGWNNSHDNFNNGYPIPFIRAAVLSAVIRQGQTVVALLDGRNNVGFSGSAIIAEHVPPKDPEYGPKIIAVSTGFHNERTVHPSETSSKKAEIDGYSLSDDHVHLTNSGFIISHSINHALEIIENNPHGFKLDP